MKVVVALAATASALVAPVAKVAPATSLDAKSAAMPFLECPAALDGLDSVSYTHLTLPTKA